MVNGRCGGDVPAGVEGDVGARFWFWQPRLQICSKRGPLLSHFTLVGSTHISSRNCGPSTGHFDVWRIKDVRHMQIALDNNMRLSARVCVRVDPYLTRFRSERILSLTCDWLGWFRVLTNQQTHSNPKATDRSSRPVLRICR